MVILTRRYNFSAAHRLWNKALSDEENHHYFGGCSKIHGHNYILEVSIQGHPNAKTGMIMNISDLDDIVEAKLLSLVDHRCLDEDVPFLEGHVATLENVATIFYDRLIAEIQPPVMLNRLRLYESDTNWVEVTHEERFASV
jgi:6-pyruvoyltetrahydropterin/6-carboxytetrahydropterin synthase